MEKTFDERRNNFDKLFSLVDQAIETGDNNLLSLSLQNINSLAASSPFKDISVMKDQLESGDTEWDI